jgi:hypothetical protein
VAKKHEARSQIGCAQVSSKSALGEGRGSRRKQKEGAATEHVQLAAAGHAGRNIVRPCDELRIFAGSVSRKPDPLPAAEVGLALVKKQTWQCERQSKRKEAREYLRDRKGPSKFCGNTHSIQAPRELVLDMPIGVMWINRKPTVESQGIVKRIYEEIPSVQIHKAE